MNLWAVLKRDAQVASLRVRGVISRRITCKKLILNFAVRSAKFTGCLCTEVIVESIQTSTGVIVWREFIPQAGMPASHKTIGEPDQVEMVICGTNGDIKDIGTAICCWII